ncbi:ChaN family lipoprotein [Shimia sp. R11_0]|uniref:ChaN family lipoprotein n=1 Tax=Shimia sp. R11_0 TaxID=2821096 RepID=UPI001ADD39DB|nr:ChaN family lipoprotein [Shimia sp. R11_0]MBO9478306.1 ChaN family lipoprotein [Shimia sp. R11_0]
MKNYILPFVSSLVLSVAAAGAQTVDFTAYPSADVFFLGEVHDNPTHHETQAQAVREIEPGAIVFEMLVPEQAAKITEALLQDPVALEAALGWNDSGWPDFAIYYPIFAAAGRANIYGAQVPRGAARDAVRNGDLSGTLNGEAALYGLTEALPAEQQATREQMQMEAHCNALPEAMLPGMVAAQRLRDARLAQATVQAWAESGGPVVVITGNGHARTDWGAPSLLPDMLSSVSLGQLEADPEGTQPYDIWVVTAPADREDPCAAFQ